MLKDDDKSWVQRLNDYFEPLKELKDLEILENFNSLSALRELSKVYTLDDAQGLADRLKELNNLRDKLPEMQETTERLYGKMSENYGWFMKLISSLVGMVSNLNLQETLPSMIKQMSNFEVLADPRRVENAVRHALEKGTFHVGETYKAWQAGDKSQPRTIQFVVDNFLFTGTFTICDNDKEDYTLDANKPSETIVQEKSFNEKMRNLGRNHLVHTTSKDGLKLQFTFKRLDEVKHDNSTSLEEVK